MENYTPSPYPPFMYGPDEEEHDQSQNRYEAQWLLNPAAQNTIGGYDSFHNVSGGQPPIHEGFIPAADDHDSYQIAPSRNVVYHGQESLIHGRFEGEASHDSSMEDSEQEDFQALDEQFGFHNIREDDEIIDPDYEYPERVPSPDDLSDSDILTDSRPRRYGAGRTGRGRGRGRGVDPARGQSQGRGRGRGRGRPPGRASMGRSRGHDGARRGRGRGKRRKKEPDPGLEFKDYHARATAAFIENRYEEALEYAQKAADANSQVFALHNLVAKIWDAMGNKLRSVMALTVGAYSKRDKNLWWYIADQYEEIDNLSEELRNQRRTLCMYRILEIDPDDCDARSELVRINLEMNRFGGAMMQCRQILRRRPKDTEVLRQLAYICSIAGPRQLGVEKSATVFEECFNSFRDTEEPGHTVLDWSLLNIYLELLQRLGWYRQGLSKLNYFSRWLLGRSEEAFWDDIGDDREWDIDDEPRRGAVGAFVPGRFPMDRYGLGLPLELRAKLGVFRLHHGELQNLHEAMRHFNIIYSINEPPNLEALGDYSDVFREIGDSLQKHGYYREALRFYESLKQLPSQPNPRLCMALGDCHRALNHNTEAYDYFLAVLDIPSDFRVRARGYIVQLLDERGSIEESLGEARLLARTKQGQDILKTLKLSYNLPSELTEPKAPEPPTWRRGPKPPREPKLRRAALPGLFDEDIPESLKMQRLNSNLLELQPQVDCGNDEAIDEWLKSSEMLIQEFKDWENLIRVAILRKEREEKEAKEARLQRTKTFGDVAATTVVHEPGEAAIRGFAQFRGILFDRWLEIFCQYNHLLATRGNPQCIQNLIECETFEVFSRKTEDIECLQISRLACGILLNNEHEICQVSRWLLKQHPFATNSYRIYAVANRLFSGHRTWYNSGPNQKFALRHLRSLDYLLLTPEQREQYNFTIHSKSSFVLNDPAATEIKEHDPSLFAMYAHIMASGTRYVNALNYYFRAYALVPDDPLLNLSIGLSYLQLALKNKAENRQLHIQQALAYLFRYRSLRVEAGSPVCEQEAEYNIARAWHMLGLTHLALPGYKRVLELSEMLSEEESARKGGAQSREAPGEDFGADAAFAIQQILALNEDYESAREITEQWLVIE